MLCIKLGPRRKANVNLQRPACQSTISESGDGEVTTIFISAVQSHTRDICKKRLNHCFLEVQGRCQVGDMQLHSSAGGGWAVGGRSDKNPQHMK